MRNWLKTLVLIFLTGMTSISFAQFGEEFDSFIKKYPDENEITYYDESEVVFKMEKDSIIVTNNHHTERWIISDKVLVSAKRSIPYSGFNELIEIQAHSLIPNNGKYKKVKVKEFTHKDDLDNSIFYDDYKSANFRFPSVSQGVKTIIDYKYKINNMRHVYQYYFNNYSPIEKGVFKVQFPKGVRIKYKMFNCDSTDIQFTKEEKKGTNYYTWTVNEPKKMKYESGGLDPKYRIPHIILYLEGYDKSNGTTEIYSDVKRLYNWYYKLAQPVNDTIQLDKNLVTVTDSLTKGLTNDLDKMKAIYYWVQTNINYVAFENGMEGFVPRSAANVCNSKYGDCKGMASIIFGMAKIAKLKAYYTWIGTNSIPYTYRELPTLAVDNHMIATYIDKDSNYYFMDATSDFIKFGTPSSFIQGKEALIGVNKDRFIIHEVPYQESSKNLIKDSVSIAIEDNKVIGTGYIEISGYYKNSLTRTLQDLNEKDKKIALTSYLEKGSNKFQLSSFELINRNKRDLPLIIKYEFELDNYVTKLEDELYVNLYLEKALNYSKIEKDREEALSYTFKNKREFAVTLKIPDGHELTYQPKDLISQHEGFSFQCDYKQNSKQIDLHYVIIKDMHLLEKNRFKEWNKMIDMVRKSYGESIILKK